jgi:hypothetical protein
MLHAGDVGGVWARSAGPHRVVADVAVPQSLSIEAGALVCAHPGAAIVVGPSGALEAHGTADRPITFTASTPDDRWGGIRYGAPQTTDQVIVSLRHVVIEDAQVGVQGSWGGVNVEHAVFRQLDAAAVRGIDISLRDVVVDNACNGLADSCVAVAVLANGRGHMENTVVRGSGAGGVSVLWRSTLHLANVLIEGADGVGLYASADAAGPAVLTVEHPVRITGGGSYPALLGHHAAGVLLDTEAAQQRLLGNARDTVVVRGEVGTAPDVIVTRHLPWSLTTGFSASWRTIRLEPGATLHLPTAAAVPLSVLRFIAAGTAEHPVTVTGQGSLHIGSQGSVAEPSLIAHAVLEGIDLLARSGTLISFEDMVVRNAHLSILAAGTRLERIAVHGGLMSTVAEALLVGAADVSISDCTVTGSPFDGIRVLIAAGVRVRDCNIHGNAGVGLRNDDAQPVDAVQNWWGDPAGPHGPQGDGVAGPVLYQPFRTAPVPGAPTVSVRRP